MPAVAFRSVAIDDNPGGASTAQLSIPKPAGALDGDFLLASIGVAGGSGSSVSAPVGWTLLRRVDLGTNVSLAVYYKVASSEPARWSWSFGAAGTHVGAVRAYVNVDTFAAIDAEAGRAIPSGTSQGTPSVTTSVGNTILAASFAAGANVTFTAPSGYVERTQKSQTNASLEASDTQVTAPGMVPSATATASAGTVGCAHAIVLRPAVGRYSADEAAAVLKALFPPGASDLYDWDNAASDIAKIVGGLGDGWKRYGFDLVDLVRREFNPATAVLKLADWESAFGIPLAAAGAANAWIATRQASVVGKWRESGASTLANIRAAIEPLLGYSGPNVGTVVVVECNRQSLTNLHTYSNNTGGAIPANGNITQTVNVPDDAGVSAAGVQLILTITHNNPEQVAVTLTAPGGAPSVTWNAGTLPKGAVTLFGFFLYDKVVMPGGPLSGKWTLQVSTGATAGTLGGWSLFVEGAGRDAAGNDGLGAAIFDWGVLAEVAKLGPNPDYVGVRNAIARINPAYARGHLLFQTNGGAGYQTLAIPDDPNCLPDSVIPA